MGSHSNKAYAEKAAGLPRPENRWPRWIVTAGGLGLLRPAPGSWGTAGAAAIYYLALLSGMEPLQRTILLLGGAAVAGAALVYFGFWACAYFQKIDPGQVVLDEFTGFWVAVAFLPVPSRLQHGLLGPWLFTAGIYLIFRLTDTLKFPPCRQLERLSFGWGILLDDVAAGIQANLIAQILVHAVPWLGQK